MKNYMILFSSLALILFGSCEKIKDATAIDIDTDIQVDVPVTSENTVAINLKSVQMADGVYSFVGSNTFSLEDNNDLKKYVDNIRNIKASEGGVLTFVGATDGNKILTCQISYGIQDSLSSDPEMLNTFTIPEVLIANNGVIEYYLNTGADLLVNSIEQYKDKYFKLSLSGTANYDVETTVKLKVPVTVSASPL